jgi:hypothetical protein
MKELTRKEILENRIFECERSINTWGSEWDILHERTRALSKLIKLERTTIKEIQKELDQMANAAFVAKAERGR